MNTITNTTNTLTNSNKVLLKETEYRSLLQSIKELQIKVHEMETSKFWRLKLFVSKIISFLGEYSASAKWLKEKPVSILTDDDIEKKLRWKPYETWIFQNTPRKSDLHNYIDNMYYFSYKPLISIIVPVYNTPIPYLQKMIHSVQEQIYTNWELCLADDNSSNLEVKKELSKYAELDSRIKVVFREQNGHISVCSNSALSIAKGEFTALLDHDDLIAPEALYEVVNSLNKNKDLDFIYTDEDKVDDEGFFSDPHFKPNWCPENFLGRNYISHFAVIRSSLIFSIGGFREGFEGSQDYDLYLRLFEITNKIHHIPKVLYHWRMHAESTALNQSAKSYAYDAGFKALSEASKKFKESTEVTFHDSIPGYYRIKFKIREEKLVSIIISTKDKSDILAICLDSIFNKSTYKNFEIILINNNSTEESLEILINEYSIKYPEKFFCYRYDVPFNYSLLMNYAASKSNGDYFLFLNNDTEVISYDWIESMLEHAQRDEIGIVGAKLYYPNDTIQHAGVIIGMGGVAGHCFAGLHKNEFSYFHYANCLNNFSAVTAACMMCRRDVFNEVNGFDEEYKVEFNDTDLCLRIKEAGYRNVYTPNAQLYHHESISRGHALATVESRQIHNYSVVRFQTKWNKYIIDDPCYNKNLSLVESYFTVRLE
jgi:glycosyltransferase involved in cell wall biosynthesis